jgi:16S rRNA (cytosine1402-N4)-methyltransferase
MNSELATTRHRAVLQQEVLSFFAPLFPGQFLDFTLGGGGHTRLILNAHPENRIAAFDRDINAIKRAATWQQEYGDRLKITHSSFAQAARALPQHSFAGLLADLGLSTDQLFEDRGFSFHDQGPLDMRMDQGGDLTAAQLVNELETSELIAVLRSGGVTADARLFARIIVDNRPFLSAKDLAQAIYNNTPIPLRPKNGSHPATVVFQALRIAVNREFDQLEQLLDCAPKLVRQNGGRCALIAFHSLEDKFLAKKMRQWENGGEWSAAMPTGTRPAPSLGKLLTPKAVQPGSTEVAENPSARSARLRVFEFCSGN